MSHILKMEAAQMEHKLLRLFWGLFALGVRVRGYFTQVQENYIFFLMFSKYCNKSFLNFILVRWFLMS